MFFQLQYNIMLGAGEETYVKANFIKRNLMIKEYIVLEKQETKNLLG